MSKTLIPQSENKFDTFARQFLGRISKDPQVYFVSPDDLNEAEQLLNEWETNFAALVAARDAAKAATRRKDASMEDLSEKLRDMARLIQANKKISNADRADAGLPIHKTSRTPVAIPKTVPTGTVIATDRLEHTLSYSDASTPTRKARPAGAASCEIFVAVAEAAPTDPADYRFAALSTRTPERITFKSEDGGKNAHYLMRWVNTRAESGPWSQVISATIPSI